MSLRMCLYGAVAVVLLIIILTLQDSSLESSVNTYLSYTPDRKYIFQNVKSSVPDRKYVSHPMCSKTPENLRGKINISLEERKMEDIENDLDFIQPGGSFTPKNCSPVFNVAILVAYRWRYHHLVVLLNNLHPILARHNIHYRIFIINQNGNNTFNKGMLWNIGFTEALKLKQFDCIFLHDVDHLPEDDRNLYHCPPQPWHVAGAVDRFGYLNQWAGYVGGCLAMLTAHFKIVNGFSNRYWGWGGEDDDMSNRIVMANLELIRLDTMESRMMTLKHVTNETGNEINNVNMDLKMDPVGGMASGLSSLTSCRFEVTDVVEEKLYTNISVTLEMA